MKVIAPLTYDVSGIPTRGRTGQRRSYPVVELVEGEIDEADELDAELVLRTITSFGTYRKPREWRVLGGTLIGAVGGDNPLPASNIPHWRDGTARGNYQFMFVDQFKVEEQLKGVIIEMLRAGRPASSGVAELRLSDRKCNRGERLEAVNTVLSDLVLVGGRLWRRTPEPLMCVYVSDTIVYGDYVDSTTSRFDTRGWETVYLPLCDACRAAGIGEVMGLEPRIPIEIAEVARPEFLQADGKQMTLRAAADALLEASAPDIGNVSRDTVARWLALREAATTGAHVDQASISSLADELELGREGKGRWCRTLLAITDRLYGDEPGYADAPPASADAATYPARP